MGSIGSHGEPLVAVGDVFNPPADINAATLFAKKVGGFKADSRSVRLNLTSPDVWEGLFFADTDTPCLWEYQGGDWVLRNNPTFATANLRDSAIPAPQAGYQIYRSDRGYNEFHNGSTWQALGGNIPVIPSAAAITGGTGTATINPDGSVTAVTTAGTSSLIIRDCMPSVALYGSDEAKISVSWTGAASNILLRMALAGVADTAGGYDYYGQTFNQNGAGSAALAQNATYWPIVDAVPPIEYYAEIGMRFANESTRRIRSFMRANSVGAVGSNERLILVDMNLRPTTLFDGLAFTGIGVGTLNVKVVRP